MSHPCYGRFQVAEAHSALLNLHLHDGVTPLKEVDHEIPLAVLDQSDLEQQGIFTSQFIPGCKVDAKALGSCTANTTTEVMSGLLDEEDFVRFLTLDGVTRPLPLLSPTWVPYRDVDVAEAAAIYFYYLCTKQTGTPSEEWPPTDCGSTGAYCINELQRLGFIDGAKIASAGQNLISLLQSGAVMMGSPWFYRWEEPDSAGFIDGDGTVSELEAAIRSGVAGGHETTIVAIEKLTLDALERVIPEKTVLRIRNHWTKGWGDNGCCRVYLSTLMRISSACDFRQPFLRS